jgi:hypothetical protein
MSDIAYPYLVSIVRHNNYKRNELSLKDNPAIRERDVRSLSHFNWDMQMFGLERVMVYRCKHLSR